ncbi:MAG: ATP-binding protein [Anaerolineae bacterium]|nr:ATP-binding protein [Anaerolineae bacterium]
MAEAQSQKEYFPINSLVDVVRARRRGLEMAQALGFPLAEATKIAVVISELGRNIERYVGQGSITVTAHSEDEKYILIVAQDNGAGIPDVDRAMAGGYSTSGGLGLGLSGSKRLMDKFDIKSITGVGTTIKTVKWLR